MRWPWLRRRHRCPPGIRLVLKINGDKVVNCDSVSLAIIAKFGAADGRLDLLDGFYGEIRTVEAWIERADLPA